MTSPSLLGTLKDGFGEAVVACDMPNHASVRLHNLSVCQECVGVEGLLTLLAEELKLLGLLTLSTEELKMLGQPKMHTFTGPSGCPAFIP